MDDTDLSFDFEGGLDAVPAPASAIPSSAPAELSLQNPTPAPGLGTFQADPVSNGGGNFPGRRGYRQTVCRHWLRSLCMKGDNCGFLHQYDKSRMPICRFFRMYGECREQDCVYKHTNEDMKECNMYKMGFCPNGPDCRYRHAKLPGPPPPVEEVLQRIQQLSSFNYGASNRFQHRGSNYSQQPERPQFPQFSGIPNQVPQFSGVPNQVTAVRPPTVLEPPNTHQPQPHNQQSQQQQHSYNQAQNIANGSSSQANRTAAPLPQGQSRCVWSF